MRPTPRRRLPLLALGALALAACDSTAPGDGAGEEEFFTRVAVTLTPDGGGKPVVLTATDADGDGAGVLYGQSTPLTAGTYAAAITLRDDVNGADVTPEIVAERDVHRFFHAFTPTSGPSRVAISSPNLDANGLPFGQAFTVTVAAGTGGSGTLRVVLAHYEGAGKRATDTLDDRPGTGTDLDLTYPVAVQ